MAIPGRSVCSPTELPVPAPQESDAIVGMAAEVPDFSTQTGATNTHLSTKSGDWSDSTVWSTGIVPTSLDDDVHILQGHTVTISDENAKGRNVIIDPCTHTSPPALTGNIAKLKFSRSNNTKLHCVNLIANNESALEIGTKSQPILAHNTAEVVFEPVNINYKFDPFQWGNGLHLWGRSEARIAGSTKTNMIEASVNPVATDTTLTLKQAPVGWRIGDKLVIPDTLPLLRTVDTYYELGEWVDDHYLTRNFSEERTITSISGNVITIDSPLDHDHPGQSYTGGGKSFDFKVWIANQTRNVKFRCNVSTAFHVPTEPMVKGKLKNLAQVDSYAYGDGTSDTEVQFTTKNENRDPGVHRWAVNDVIAIANSSSKPLGVERMRITAVVDNGTTSTITAARGDANLYSRYAPMNDDFVGEPGYTDPQPSQLDSILATSAAVWLAGEWNGSDDIGMEVSFVDESGSGGHDVSEFLVGEFYCCDYEWVQIVSVDVPSQTVRMRRGMRDQIMSLWNDWRPGTNRTAYMHRPTGQSHMYANGHCDLRMQYAQFYDMGRSLPQLADLTQGSTIANVTRVGGSVIGKYGLHLHHCLGRRNPVEPYQSEVIGCVTDGNYQHLSRWAQTYHMSSWGQWNNNNSYNSRGAQIVWDEAGGSVENEIKNNFACLTWSRSEKFRHSNDTVKGQDGNNITLYTGREPVNMWFRGGDRFTMEGNVTCNAGCLSSDTAFGFEHLNESLGSMMIPDVKGQHPTEGSSVSGHDVYLTSFLNNVVFGSYQGATYWHIGGKPANERFIPIDTYWTWDGLTCWNLGNRSIFGYPCCGFECKNHVVINGQNGVVQGANTTGFVPGDYTHDQLRFYDCFLVEAAPMIKMSYGRGLVDVQNCYCDMSGLFIELEGFRNTNGTYHYNTYPGYDTRVKDVEFGGASAGTINFSSPPVNTGRNAYSNIYAQKNILYNRKGESEHYLVTADCQRESDVPLEDDVRVGTIARHLDGSKYTNGELNRTFDYPWARHAGFENQDGKRRVKFSTNENPDPEDWWPALPFFRGKAETSNAAGAVEAQRQRTHADWIDLGATVTANTSTNWTIDIASGVDNSQTTSENFSVAAIAGTVGGADLEIQLTNNESPRCTRLGQVITDPNTNQYKITDARYVKINGTTWTEYYSVEPVSHSTEPITGTWNVTARLIDAGFLMFQANGSKSINGVTCTGSFWRVESATSTQITVEWFGPGAAVAPTGSAKAYFSDGEVIEVTDSYLISGVRRYYHSRTSEHELFPNPGYSWWGLASLPRTNLDDNGVCVFHRVIPDSYPVAAGELAAASNEIIQVNPDGSLIV